jgi:hypothetical protein
LETSIRSYTRGMDRWCELRIGEELEPTSSWWRRRGGGRGGEERRATEHHT